jgi:hypothetical protein
MRDPADVWDDYCEEVAPENRSHQGALAFGFDAALTPDTLLAQSEIERLRRTLLFIGNWIAKPPSSFSMAALDVVFKKIRTKVTETLAERKP